MSGFYVLPPFIQNPAAAVQEPDARVHHIPEAVLHEVWASQHFATNHLRTTEDAGLTILDPGVLNRDAGPDFLNARLRITHPDAPGGTLDWVGDVELHRTSGEWLLHHHHTDARYNSVVLHVVLVDDRHTGSLARADSTALPELVLYDHLGESLRSLLHRFYATPRTAFYCASQWRSVPDTLKTPWVRQLGLDRLRQKVERLAQIYTRRPELDELLRVVIFRALGYAKNTEPMTELAARTPFAFIQHLDDQRDIEALLFGLAGLIPDVRAMLQSDHHSTRYVEELRDRFARLGERLALSPMNAVQWQFFRLRPANFPTRRIAQAAALLAPAEAGQEPGLLRDDPLGRLRRALLDPKPERALRALIQSTEPASFWNDHVRFNERSATGSNRIGRSRSDRMLVDAVLPVLLLDAEQRGDEGQHERILSLLTRLPGASDEITRHFEREGTKPSTALDTQGLHHLYHAWCTPGRCLTCAIGRALLQDG